MAKKAKPKAKQRLMQTQDVTRFLKTATPEQKLAFGNDLRADRVVITGLLKVPTPDIEGRRRVSRLPEVEEVPPRSSPRSR